MTRPTHITINLAALQNNQRQIRQITRASILAMVKANAYGHGLKLIAQALPHVDALGVACIEEGIALREAGNNQTIVLVEGIFDEEELGLALRYQFNLVVHHQFQVELLEKNKQTGSPLSVWLKINSGMNRLGFPSEQASSFFYRLRKCSSVNPAIILMTHLAESESLTREITQNQLTLFNQATFSLPGLRSIANSGGILAWPESHADWVRPGLMLYGASPFSKKQGKDHGLEPVMSFHSKLIAVNRLKKGERVGYGGDWICPEERMVGVVPVGYGDGYPRDAKSGTPILVKDKKCTLIGRVSMDMLVVDLSNQPNASVGDDVLLWGNNLPVEDVAFYSGISSYELLTRISPRVYVKTIE